MKKKQVTLKLERPICFLDLETTGLIPHKDRIVEIALLKIETDGVEKVKQSLIFPGIPIPEEVTKIHGITNEMVKDKPRFGSFAKSIHEFIFDCDIAGFNSNKFDVPFLYFELERAGVKWDWRKVNLIDVGNIFKQKEERTLEAAVRFYLKKEHTKAHSAAGDVKETRNIFFAQRERYSDLPFDLKELALYSNWGNEIVDLAGYFTKDKDGDICFNFGQHKGKKAKTEKGYLNWMRQSDFPQDTINIANKISFL